MLARVLRRVAACVCACSTVAFAADNPIAGAARSIPDSAQTLIIVDDAAGIRRSNVGGAATELVSGIADFTRTREAWSRLAQQLGLTDAETFDALLGRRMLFAASRLPDKTLDWVILSTISADIESRLRDALKPAPRTIESGLPVLGVENGRFELVIAPRNDERLLILAPAGSTGLFESVVRGIRKGGPDASLADTEPLRRAIALSTGARALAVFKEDQSWLSVALRLDQQAIRADFIAGGPGVGVAEVKPWSLDKFTAAADGALLTIVESDSLPTELRIATRIGQEPLSRALMPPDPHRLRGGRVVVRASPSAEGPIDFAIGMQTSSVDRLAVDGDRSIAKFLGTLRGAADTAQLPYDFAGAAPAATRIVNLRPFLPAPARLGWKDGPELAWSFRTGGVTEGGDQAGWWTIGIGRQSVDRLADILTEQDPPDRVAAWLSAGMIRPADIVSTLKAQNFPIPEGMQTLQWIAKVQWKAIRTPDALIQGDAGVELALTPPANAAPRP